MRMVKVFCEDQECEYVYICILIRKRIEIKKPE
jgi:hypothetical protein